MIKPRIPRPPPRTVRAGFAPAAACALGLVMVCGARATAQEAADGPAYPVGKFTLVYLHRGHPEQPKRERLMRLNVTLGTTPEGYVAPREGVPEATFRLEEVEARPVENYFASAVQVILQTIYDELARRDLLGVYVAPDPRHISGTGEDLRPAGRTSLRILITTSIVTDMRTLASGPRIPPEQRIDHPVHGGILSHSPLRPFAEGDKERHDLLRRKVLDDYLFRLSRHPGRRVDAAIAPGTEPGGVTLDYLVAENQPLLVYAQLSNTGTRSTDRLRERVGFVDNQLTNHDDILSFDYTTAAFDQFNAVSASYEAPLPFGSDRIRWRLFGSWSEFTASDVGVFSDVFTGESRSIGGEVIWNFFQNRSLFVDIVGGLRFDRISVDNQATGISGEENFTLAHFGLRLAQQARWYHLAASLTAEFNDGQTPRPNPAQLTRLGRLLPDPDFGILRWDFSGATFLEPLLDHAAWADPTTPASSTLAHELALSFRGQFAFDNRLIPQYEQVVGGLYSVRGYPQSVVAGDSAVVANLEYRFHLPRVLAIDPEPSELFGRPFRFAPQRVYGQVDWDLMFRAFLDVGRTFINDRLFFERNQTLVGAGVGVELQYRRNLTARVDWGFALKGLDSPNVDRGSNRVHFVTTFSF